MKKAASPPRPSLSTRLIDRVIHLPRLARILMAAAFALAVTLTVTPIIDEAYLSLFYDTETRMSPAIISTVLGVAYYLLGWRLIIGYAGETPAPRRSILWYFGIGAAACAVVVVLVIIGAVSGTLE
jgi:amino acid transporter